MSQKVVPQRNFMGLLSALENGPGPVVAARPEIDHPEFPVGFGLMGFRLPIATLF